MTALPCVATLCLGSNVEPREENLKHGLELLCCAFSDGYVQSSVYETPSHSGHGEAYLNQVVKGKLGITYEELLKLTKTIERKLGRTPASKTEGKVPLDIDVVLLNGDVLRQFDYNAIHFQIGYTQLNRQSELNDDRTKR